jgi:hypothetical protein
MDANECRKRAEECVRAAQNAKPHHRALLLDIANKWLELTAYDEWTRELLSTSEPDKRPECRGPKDQAARPTRST